MASSIYIFKINERKVEDAMATMLGIVYVVFFSYHVTLVDQTQEYANLVWIILLSAFATDIFAYFSGYLFGRHGRHKLCPNLSPKKTWEGAIGGTLGSIIHSIAYVILFLLSMLVLTWLLRLITIPLRLVERVPVLGLANRLGGAVLGLIMGILICFLVTAVVKLTGFIDPADTYLYSFFAANTPQSLLGLFL